MAGIAEEIVFRGLILQEINKKWLFGKQILLQLSYFWS
ncbi:type II CAAX prenyl endopeptidase Rce1 family protein [Metabacillus litoralis]|jgi:membrane protease YdiL (CAAX protease family)